MKCLFVVSIRSMHQGMEQLKPTHHESLNVLRPGLASYVARGMKLKYTKIGSLMLLAGL